MAGWWKSYTCCILGALIQNDRNIFSKNRIKYNSGLNNMLDSEKCDDYIVFTIMFCVFLTLS